MLFQKLFAKEALDLSLKSKRYQSRNCGEKRRTENTHSSVYESLRRRTESALQGLEVSNRNARLSSLHADKSLQPRELRKFGSTPSKIQEKQERELPGIAVLWGGIT